ncbi:unnamed product [Ostreococcus tauri]|uniref:Unnamed product n=1 Tax=Ostreococcus tauri TaxID=70448 RepID=A0A090LZU1_OSTTA|nr:unnamed product [Ostreococcus tauri]OUS49386.1 hypothetical protein BE221DRAFT_202639 [Ostreococcus tauri]CEF97535.1 unnamed product [Ostreococcus tauri]|eukprot:XP_003078721.2 unnamed product [Ostreococcus tauri]
MSLLALPAPRSREIARARARTTRNVNDDAVEDSSSRATEESLERALANASARARECAVRVVELERSNSELAVRCGRAEARAKALGERLEERARGAGGTASAETMSARCEALERANEKLTLAWRERSERADELEGALEASRRVSAERAAAKTETVGGEDERAERREREIGRLRRELSKQAQVIADAYRDELMRLQKELKASEVRCEALQRENEALRLRDEKLPRTYESPYTYAKFSSKHDAASSPARAPLTPLSENVSSPRRSSVFDRLSTPKRIAAATHRSPRSVR